MTATVTPITARRRPASLTHDPYLLRCTERLHQVDARQMPAHVAGAAVGHCRTDLVAEPLPDAHPADDLQGHGTDHLYADLTVSARVARWLRRLFNR